MISRFFIDRPIFATVLSVVITLIGGISLFFLPVAQYPRITPPGVNISISYPGASAQVVADTVAAPIEQQVNGVEGMLYMSSQSGNDGTYSLTVTFDIGTDLNTAVVKVQNRVALAMPQLPTEVQNQGITIRKKTPDILMIVNFFSPDGRYDDIYLSNYATINVRDELLRVPGVSDITYQGQRDYSIRCWLESAEDGGLQHYRRGRCQRDPQPEPGCAGGLDRPAACLREPGLRAAHQHVGPAQHAGAVRRHHRQGRHERSASVVPHGHRAAPRQFRLAEFRCRRTPAAAASGGTTGGGTASDSTSGSAPATTDGTATTAARRNGTDDRRTATAAARHGRRLRTHGRRRDHGRRGNLGRRRLDRGRWNDGRCGDGRRGSDIDNRLHDRRHRGKQRRNAGSRAGPAVVRRRPPAGRGPHRAGRAELQRIVQL